jgi:hypothetical protein
MWQLNGLASRTEELRAEHLCSGSSGDRKADLLLRTISQRGTVMKRGAEPCCQEEKQTEGKRITSRKNRGSKNRRLETWLHANAVAREGETEAKSCRRRRQNLTQQQKTAAWAMLEPKESVLTENKIEEPENTPEKSRARKIVRKHAYRHPLAEELITREQDLSRSEWWIEKKLCTDARLVPVVSKSIFDSAACSPERTKEKNWNQTEEKLLHVRTEW